MRGFDCAHARRSHPLRHSGPGRPARHGPQRAGRYRQRRACRRSPFLRHLRHHGGRRKDLRPAARTLSGRDDHRAPASVLGHEGHRRAVRGRIVVRRRCGTAGDSARRDQEVRRPCGPVHAGVRDALRSRGRRRRRRRCRNAARSGEAQTQVAIPARRQRRQTGRQGQQTRAGTHQRAREPAARRRKHRDGERQALAQTSRPTSPAAPKWSGSTASARSDGQGFDHQAFDHQAFDHGGFGHRAPPGSQPNRERYLRPDRGRGRPLLGRADPAFHRELPDRHRAHAAAADPRARRRQACRGRGEPVAQAD